jgi:hypothetical protein
MRRYRYHGVTVESPLALNLRGGSSPPGAARVTIRPVAGLKEPAGKPAWASPATGYFLYSEGSERCWLVKDHAYFVLTREEILVDPVPLDAGRMEYLGTSVLPLWLQLSGRPVLHAAAVCLDGGAVGLLASSAGGKSTLASALVARGARLLCDDHVVVHFEGSVGRVWSGRPDVRLWPDSARRLGVDVEALPRVVPSSEKRRVTLGVDAGSPTASEWCPLKVVYVLKRGAGADGSVSIETLPPTEALMALLAYGQMAGVSEMIGAGPLRLPPLARIVREVPVRKLSYPTAFEKLPDVCQAIEIDART